MTTLEEVFGDATWSVDERGTVTKQTNTVPGPCIRSSDFGPVVFIKGEILCGHMSIDAAEKAVQIYRKWQKAQEDDFLKNVRLPDGCGFIGTTKHPAIHDIVDGTTYHIPANVRLAECILEASNELAAHAARVRT